MISTGKKRKKKQYTKPKKIKKTHTTVKLATLKFYKVDGDKVTRLRKSCPSWWVSHFLLDYFYPLPFLNASCFQIHIFFSACVYLWLSSYIRIILRCVTSMNWRPFPPTSDDDVTNIVYYIVALGCLWQITLIVIIVDGAHERMFIRWKRNRGFVLFHIWYHLLEVSSFVSLLHRVSSFIWASVVTHLLKYDFQ